MAHIVFGVEDYYLARLKDDIASLAEPSTESGGGPEDGSRWTGQGDGKPLASRYGWIGSTFRAESA